MHLYERMWSGLRWRVRSRKRPPGHRRLLRLHPCPQCPLVTQLIKSVCFIWDYWCALRFPDSHKAGSVLILNDPWWLHTGGGWRRIHSVTGYSNGWERSEKSSTLQGRIHSCIKYPIHRISGSKVLSGRGGNLTRLETGAIITPMAGACHLHFQAQGPFPGQRPKSACGHPNREKGR